MVFLIILHLLLYIQFSWWSRADIPGGCSVVFAKKRENVGTVDSPVQNETRNVVEVNSATDLETVQSALEIQEHNNNQSQFSVKMIVPGTENQDHKTVIISVVKELCQRNQVLTVRRFIVDNFFEYLFWIRLGIMTSLWNSIKCLTKSWTKFWNLG